MGRRLRGLVKDRLVEITTRTIQSRYLLRPSREVNNTVLGVLGRAQRQTEMRLCAFVFMSNHYHLLVVPDSLSQLKAFMRFLNGNAARKVGEINGWEGRFWECRYQHVIVSDEPEAQIGRLRYMLSQGVKEGLVRKPHDWPGVHCVHEIERDECTVAGGQWHDQTAHYYANRRRKPSIDNDFFHNESVEICPIPCLDEASRAERLSVVQEALRHVDGLGRSWRESSRRAPLGRKRILRQDPHDSPKEISRSPAPQFHAFSGAHYSELREAYWEYRQAFEEASRQLALGNQTPHFPPGSFPPGLPYVPEARAGP